jgi:drug/metabolite transporter (DMT)-like permease
MSHIAILLIILSAILHAIWNYLAKGGRDIIVFFWWSLLLQLLIFAPFVLYILRNSKVDPNGWYIALASGVFVFFAWLFLAYSYKYGDLSLVYPIARSAPLFVSILAVIFFKEKLSPLGVFGILTVVLGVYIIPMRSLDIKNLLKPFSHLTGILTLYICLSERRRLIRGEWKLNRWSALATGILVMFSYSLIVFVMRFEKISYVISMRQVSIVLGVILGNVLLKEQYGLVRFIASCLIFFGVSCIGMAE